MIVDDGFSVLDTDFGLGERKAVSEVKVVKVPIDTIFPNPYQPRKNFDDAALEDLSASIAQYGVLQPLLLLAYRCWFRLQRMAAICSSPENAVCVRPKWRSWPRCR